MISRSEPPSKKEWNGSFDIRNFFSEWDHWCEHRITIIDKKFGSMPFIPPGQGGQWYRWDQQLINKTMNEHPVVRLYWGALDEQIEMLFNACALTEKPRLIISDTQIPHTPPDNVRVIVTEPNAYQFSRTFADTKTKPTYNRRVRDLQHPFMIMARGQDYGRPELMLMLKQLGLLQDALYSSGDILAGDHQFMSDPVGINLSMKDISTRVLGGEYVKYDVKKNLETLPGLINLCHFYVGVDTNGLYHEKVLHSVCEKNLWGYTTTVPVLPIWYDSTAHQMQEWGYRFTNITHRREGETDQDTVIRWCREILFHYQITLNEQWSQSWQDQQGETTIHNFELTRRLHQIILDSIERQIAELPPEFQNL